MFSVLRTHRRAIYTVALVQLAFNTGCASRVAKTPWSFDDGVGIVAATPDRSCFVTRALALSAKTPIRIVDPNSQRQVQATIVTATDSCVDGNGLGAEFRGYTIQFDGAPPPLPFYGIGVLGAGAPLRTANGAMLADLDGDGRDEFFRACTSAEGVHLTIWSGAPLTGERRWHQYQALGYDVGATCSTAETAES